MESLAVVVPKRKGEEVRRLLIREGLLRQNLRIKVEGDRLLIPVKHEAAVGYPLRRAEFGEVAAKPTSYKTLVDVPEHLRPYLPTSYDIIGEVLILKMPDELEPYKKAIGRALLAAHKAVATVAVDEGVAGDWRLRTLRVIAGRGDTRTVHREFGLEISVDPTRVYFSPRLASERRHVARQVQHGEAIVDAFCGAGPFALHLARAGARVVHAIDANPTAIEFLKENIRRNRLENVNAVEGRVEEVLPRLKAVDRIVLDFPSDPLPHFREAVESLRPGGALHYYEILERAALEDRFESLRSLLPKGLGIEVIETREVRSYSPSQAHYAFDLRSVEE